MLLELHIRDFAIIKEISLDFMSGMTVLTGETGAGKSIIIDAVGLLAGGRGSTEFVRHGAKKCVIEGQFKVNPARIDKLATVLSALEIEMDSSIIHLQREMYASGRTVCRVNGSIVTVSGLKSIGEHLIDIHGQSEHQELMRPDTHIRLLDDFNRAEILPLKQKYQFFLGEYKSVKQSYEEWLTNEQAYAQRLDMLTFQVDEIEAMNLRRNEDIELEEESKKLANFQTILQALQRSYDALQEGEKAGLEQVGVAMDQLESISEIDPAYHTLAETLSSLFFQLQEASSDIYHQLDNLEFDDARLYEIEERLDAIQKLKRKYGQSIDDILDYYEEATQELSRLKNREQEVSQLNSRLEALERDLLKAGKELSEMRRQQARVLEERIHQQLQALYMEKVQFKVHFSREITAYTSRDIKGDGLDEIEFFIATNPGEPLKPLNKIASGGELSRMMLAIKTIFSTAQGITSIIFDEVDTGVSGRVAQAIADKIYSVAENSQVLCITHLPQVAARANHHLYIFKIIEDDRTRTHVKLLGEEEKIEEIARMLSGAEITEVSLEAARDLYR